MSTLKSQIVALAVAAALASGLGCAWVAGLAMQAQLTEQLLSSEQDQAHRTAVLLGSKLGTLRAAVQSLAEHAEPALRQDDAAMAHFLADKPGLGTLFEHLLVVAPDGRTLARVGREGPTPERPQLADRRYFQQALRSPQTVVSEPLRSKLGGAPLVVVAARVASPQGQVLGVVAGTVRLRSNGLFATPDVAHAATPRELVIDRQGVLLAHPEPGRVLASALDEPGLSWLLADWRRRGSAVAAEGTARFADDHLVAMAAIPQSDWVLLRVVPRAEAMAPLAAARRAAHAAALAAGALAALLAGAVAWRVLQPITRLRDQAQRMLQQPDAPPTAWPEGAGELGAMAQAFQQLLALRERERTQLQAVMDNADVGLALTRRDRFELVSRQFCRLVGHTPAQLIGASPRLLHSACEGHAEFNTRAAEEFAHRGQFDGEVPLVRRDGSTFWARLRGRALVPGDRRQGTIWVLADVTQEREHRRRLSWAASHDPLTRLLNRAAFEAQLADAVQRAADAPACLLYIDLDRFKAVNDTGGHAAGDAVLRGLATLLAHRFRRSDAVARLGGDEFAVLLADCGLDQARQTAERLRLAIEAYRLDWDGRPFGVGASIGVVALQACGPSAAEVLHAADTACYAAKRQDSNRVVATAPATPAAPTSPTAASASATPAAAAPAPAPATATAAANVPAPAVSAVSAELSE